MERFVSGIDRISGYGAITVPTPSFQERFHTRWHHLRDPHVRALAGLLDSPDLLDIDAPRWHDQLVSLGIVSEQTADWLRTLDAAPAALHEVINEQPSARLGRYAEKLLGFYLAHEGRLVAHNVQVRAGPNKTIGEFDFLVKGESAADIAHWELATKFYLLEPSAFVRQLDTFVGPNLADSLGLKITKIMEQQLLLSKHPAAQAYLPVPVGSAKALIKGWLFYHDMQTALPATLGIGKSHCRGFWCNVAGLRMDAALRYTVLSRLDWLAPARLPEEETMTTASITAHITEQFALSDAPVMVAICRVEAGVALEVDRGFVVPDDWHQRAIAKVGEQRQD
jgi:hypothetical protein